jgi:hypothetical protein
LENDARKKHPPFILAEKIAKIDRSRIKLEYDSTKKIPPFSKAEHAIKRESKMLALQ